MVRTLTWDLGDLDSLPCSSTDILCDFGQMLPICKMGITALLCWENKSIRDCEVLK